MLIETFTVGGLSTNCYVVSSRQTKDAIIIDPGIDLIFEADQIFDYIAEAGFEGEADCEHAWALRPHKRRRHIPRKIQRTHLHPPPRRGLPRGVGKHEFSRNRPAWMTAA